MGYSAYMGCGFELLDAAYKDETTVWAGKIGVRHIDKNRFDLFYEDAGYCDRAFERLAEDLSELHIPPNAWKMQVCWESTEETNVDSGIINFDIANGKVENFKVSKIEMVDENPSLYITSPDEFYSPKEQDETPFDSMFTCPKCGQGDGSFVASSVLIAGPIDVWEWNVEPREGHGLHYEIPDNATVQCGECGYEGNVAAFMV